MPEITLQHDIDTDEASFWKLTFDDAFNKQLFEGALKFPSWKVLDTKEDDAKIVRRVEVAPPVADLPGPMKKLVGDRFSYGEEGTFDKKTKRYAFKINPSAMADKTKFQGEIWVEPIGEKKVRRTVKVTVEVKVFMVGGMVEDRILADLRKSYDTGAAFTNKYLKENAL